MKFRFTWALVFLTAWLPLRGQLTTFRGGTITAEFGDDKLESITPDATFIYASTLISATLKNQGFTADKGWNFTFEGGSAADFIPESIHVVQYVPWVIDQPSVTFADGRKTEATISGEAGGALLHLTYTPMAGAPAGGIHWIQAYSQVTYGIPKMQLDIGGALPFYDDTGSATASEFSDVPGDPEMEFEINPVSTLTFNTFLVKDFGAQNGFTHDVRLYGGLQWGYTFNAYDIPPVPESSTYGVIAGSVLVALAVVRRARRKKK